MKTFLPLRSLNWLSDFFNPPWLNAIFNRVDVERIKEVGPDRACAEWLLRCGAIFYWKNMDKPVNDYNSLPVGKYRDLKIEHIDATESAIMKEGFDYLRDLTELKTMKFIKCRYIDDDGMLEFLNVCPKSLLNLEIGSLSNITDKGLVQISAKIPPHLQLLKLYDLRGVRDTHKILETVRVSSPHCKVNFSPVYK